MDKESSWWPSMWGGVVSTVVGAAILGVASLIWPTTREWLFGELILRGGWVLLLTIVTGVLIGLVAGKALWSQTPVAEAANPVVTAGPPERVELFSPSEFDVLVIRALRVGDDIWMNAQAINEFMPPGTPVADIEQAARRLAHKSYARDRFNTRTGQEFTLGDLGLDFAREQGFVPGLAGARARILHHMDNRW